MNSHRLSIMSGAIALAFMVSGCQTSPRVAEPEPLPAPPSSAPRNPSFVHAPGPWGVYFDLDKSEIRPEALPILDLVVDSYHKTGRSLVTVDGHGDTTGNSKYNIDLGQRRAEVVKAYLLSKGVDPTRIVTETQGEHDLLIPTPDEVRKRQNRRVEVRFGPL